MLSQRVLASVPKLVKRNFGISAPALQNLDPIQQLFVDKIKEYKKLGGKVEDAQLKKELKAELDRVAKQFGGGEGVDMLSFPKFSFPEPKVEVGSATPEK